MNIEDDIPKLDSADISTLSRTCLKNNTKSTEMCCADIYNKRLH